MGGGGGGLYLLGGRGDDVLCLKPLGWDFDGGGDLPVADVAREGDNPTVLRGEVFKI